MNKNSQSEIQQFFLENRVINISALGKRIGMNQSLLAQYIKGVKKPSDQQIQKILKGLHELGEELIRTNFTEK